MLYLQSCTHQRDSVERWVFPNSGPFPLIVFFVFLLSETAPMVPAQLGKLPMNGGGVWEYTSPPLDQLPTNGGGLYGTNDSLHVLTYMSLPSDFGGGWCGCGSYLL